MKKKIINKLTIGLNLIQIKTVLNYKIFTFTLTSNQSMIVIEARQQQIATF